MQTEKGRSEEEREMRRGAPKLSAKKGMSRFRDDKRKPDQEKVASSDKDVKRRRKRRPDKPQTTGRSVKIQKCQIKRKGQHQIRQEMSRTKASKRSRSRRPCQPGGQGPFL